MPDWALCDGAGNEQGDHCCYRPGGHHATLGDGVCDYLVVNGPSGRKYACGLYTELGSWAAVQADPRYVTNVKPEWDAAGVVDCGPFIGLNRAQYDAVLARGSLTEQEFQDNAQCCFRRVWCATAARRRQAVNAINRTIG